jgi:hypothetical protein
MDKGVGVGGLTAASAGGKGCGGRSVEHGRYPVVSVQYSVFSGWRREEGQFSPQPLPFGQGASRRVTTPALRAGRCAEVHEGNTRMMIGGSGWRRGGFIVIGGSVFLGGFGTPRSARGYSTTGGWMVEEVSWLVVVPTSADCTPALAGGASVRAAKNTPHLRLVSQM